MLKINCNTIELLKVYYRELIKKIEKILKIYETRNHNLNSSISRQGAIKLIGSCASTGSIIGSIVPGIGNVIGLGGGILLAAGIISCKKIHYLRIAKKKNNAKKVLSFFSTDKDALIDNIANEIISERSDILSKIETDTNNIEYVSQYLASNIMAAIKANPNRKEEPLDVIINGIRQTKSNKYNFNFFTKHKLTIKKECDQSITLKSIARNRI